MKPYIVLLRAINVSGKNIIKMAELRVFFESLNFKNVKTYIQTGNIIFQTEEISIDILTKKISEELEKFLTYHVSVFIRTPEQLEKIITDIPFDKINENEKLYISFLSELPTVKLQEELNKYNNDVDSYKIIDNQVYILCRKNYGESLFSNSFLEKKLSVKATTRNINTVNKLLNMAK